jgi:hypothetical protein
MHEVFTEAEMHEIDTDGDRKVSKAEWLAYQEAVFAALDKDKTAKISEKTFLSPSSEMVSFATGGHFPRSSNQRDDAQNRHRR